jgi:putative transposase
MDGLPGLEQAFTEAFPKAKVQRCVVHKLRNIAAKLPRKIQEDCLDLSSNEYFTLTPKRRAKERSYAWKEFFRESGPFRSKLFGKRPGCRVKLLYPT